MLLRRQLNDERDEHIDMTPMVDVVFQLMTFMLFSVQMTGGEEENVPPARHGVGVDREAATFISLVRPAAPGAAPKVVLGLSDGPTATPEQVRRAIADGVSQGRTRVILQADGAVPHGEVLRVAGALAEVGGVTLHIGVQEFR